MAGDAASRQLQYEYEAFDLDADVHRIERRRIISFLEKNAGTKMGDRAKRSKPEETEERKAKRQKRDEAQYYFMHKKEATVLSQGVDEMDEIVYRPKTHETLQAYKVLLSYIDTALAGQPSDVLSGAAHEVLVVLKNDKLKEKEKKRETEQLLGRLTDERFALFVYLGNKITDFGNDEKSAAGEENMGETYGIRVQFEESSEEDDEDVYGEVIESEEDGDEGEEANNDRVFHAENLGRAEEMKKEKTLHPRDIDAYWLQRQLKAIYNDAMISHAKAGDVLNVLKSAADDRNCENQLVLLLGYDCFDFIKQLKKYRHMIAYCTMLASSQSESERQKIRKKMSEDSTLSKILHQLETDKGEDDADETMEARIQRIRREEKEDTGEPSGLVEGTRTIIDLEEIASILDSHCRSNGPLCLPDGSYRKLREGYVDIHHAGFTPEPFGEQKKLIPESDLPTFAQPQFVGFKTLNRIQSRLPKCALEEDDYFFLCAPTGAVNTNTALLCMMREIGKHTRIEYSVKNYLKFMECNT